MFNFNYILELYQRLLLQIFETAISQQTLIGYIAKKKIESLDFITSLDILIQLLNIMMAMFNYNSVIIYLNRLA